MARIILYASYYLYAQSYKQPTVSSLSWYFADSGFVAFGSSNSPIMQHFLLQVRLLWLFIPTYAVALTAITPGSTSAGNGLLSLMIPQNLSTSIVNRLAYCKHPDDPYRFKTSLNHTLPLTPSIPESELPPAEPGTDAQTYPFDCFLELPTGVIVFEVCRMQRLFGDELESLSLLYPNITLTSILQLKGEIGSDLSLVFQVWISILVFNYDLGIYRCSLLAIDKDPCVFNINTKYLVGQAGIFPQQNADPKKLDLCFKVQATFHVPLSWKTKNINFDHCFFTFDKPHGIAISSDALSPDPDFLNSTAAAA